MTKNKNPKAKLQRQVVTQKDLQQMVRRSAVLTAKVAVQRDRAQAQRNDARKLAEAARVGLHVALSAVALVAGEHDGKLRGQTLMCPICKRKAPCKTFKALTSITPAVEKEMTGVLGSELIASDTHASGDTDTEIDEAELVTGGEGA